MLDTLNLKLALNKADYCQQLDALINRLWQLQRTARERELPVIIVLEGWAAAGKGALVKQLVHPLDPRSCQVYPILQPTEEERRYPLLWRFWQRLPRRGATAIFYHSWYTHVLEDRLFGRIKPAQVSLVLEQITEFEHQWVDDGALIVKYWLHLSRKELKKRLKAYAADPLQAWRVRPEDWRQARHYEAYASLAEAMIARTSTGTAPWTMIEADDKRWAQVKVFDHLVTNLEQTLEQTALEQARPRLSLPTPTELGPGQTDLLSRVDLSLSLAVEDYARQLAEQQVHLRKYQFQIYRHQIPVLVIFEGWDAAGKGGAIRRLTDTLDPRGYFVHSYAAPSEEEKAHHYLWRFWQQLPAAGQIGIFDRSWYGRVLVERVEELATALEWQRAYREINEFERQLTSAGVILVKFWLHISPEEQLRRFEQRAADPLRQYKLTAEDWRNRQRWAQYAVAVNQMLQRTSSTHAPWSVIEGNDKLYARVKILQTLASAIHRALK